MQTCHYHVSFKKMSPKKLFQSFSCLVLRYDIYCIPVFILFFIIILKKIIKIEILSDFFSVLHTQIFLFYCIFSKELRKAENHIHLALPGVRIHLKMLHMLASCLNSYKQFIIYLYTCMLYYILINTLFKDHIKRRTNRKKFCHQ